MDRRRFDGGRRGFTLVELLVVVGIIALLVTILMPSLSRAMELARRAVCASNLSSLGRAWRVYWNDWDNKQPPMLNPNCNPNDWINNHVADVRSQWDHLIWAGNHGIYGNTTSPAQWMNAGVLYGAKCIGDGRNYVCPTIDRNYGQPWFQSRSGSLTNDLRKMPFGAPSSYRTANYWPVVKSRSTGTHMTYGTRRCIAYDDPALGTVPNHDPGDDEIMFLESGVGIVTKPGDLSFMADGFSTPEMALLSHVPGINVLFMDSHVRYWEDTNGNILYDNGLSGLYADAGNLIHDDIWMIIDGYHKPPPGSF